MRVLGLDPGTATTGYGIIDAEDGRFSLVTFGVIQTSPKDSMPHRLQIIYRELTDLIQEYEPETAGIEELFFGRNVTTAITVGQARGILILALANANLLPIGEYSPPKIKEAVTGYGKADKQQVQMMVRNMLDLTETPRPDDAADGLAVAITHYQYHHFNTLIE